MRRLGYLEVDHLSVMGVLEKLRQWKGAGQDFGAPTRRTGQETGTEGYNEEEVVTVDRTGLVEVEPHGRSMPEQELHWQLVSKQLWAQGRVRMQLWVQVLVRGIVEVSRQQQR